MVTRTAQRSIDEGLLIPAGLRLVADNLDHPECVCWCPVSRSLYAGGEHGQLYRMPLDGGGAKLVTTIDGGFLLGLATDGLGFIYACDIGNRRVHRISPDGHVEPYGDAIGYPNYPVFAADGSLFVTDSGSWDEDSGRIVRIDPGGQTIHLASDPLRFPNGLALSDDWLYVVESTRPGIVRLPRSGGATEPVVQLERMIPDGIAFDVEGGLWIGCWQPNRILRLDAGGTLRVVAEDWSGIHILTPNNLAFAGDDLGELVFPALGGNFVRAFRPAIAGHPLHYPKVNP